MKPQPISSQRPTASATCGQVVFGAIFAVAGTAFTIVMGRPLLEEWIHSGHFPPQAFVVLFPLVFVVVGLLIAVSALRPGKRPPVAPIPGTLAEVYARPLELKPAQSGLVQFIVIAVFAAFWNGFVGFATYAAWSKEQVISLFLLPFIAVGLGLLALCAYTFLKMFNPRPHLRLDPGAIVLGGKAILDYTIIGAANRIENLRISLEGTEEARYRQGTRTVTATSVFECIVVLETEKAAEIRGGAVELQVPEFTMHTFQAPNNKITWSVKVAGVIRRWPDIDESFPITVLPLPTKQG